MDTGREPVTTWKREDNEIAKSSDNSKTKLEKKKPSLLDELQNSFRRLYQSLGQKNGR